MIVADAIYTEMTVQYTIVGLILLAACVWIILKIIKKNKSQTEGGCCGCSLSDNCNKKNLKLHGNDKNLQQQHCGESNRTRG
ncbi:MAG: FeoB-associated Cys-rich membrane protein [Muribaculaceae bacterium]|nr:FeoB-associated Cys-rich membrane protein [Muribaculaceae bacterium]